MGARMARLCETACWMEAGVKRDVHTTGVRRLTCRTCTLCELGSHQHRCIRIVLVRMVNIRAATSCVYVCVVTSSVMMEAFNNFR